MTIQQNAAKYAAYRKALFLLLLLLLLFWQRTLILRLLSQLFLGSLTAMAALPQQPLISRCALTSMYNDTDLEIDKPREAAIVVTLSELS